MPAPRGTAARAFTAFAALGLGGCFASSGETSIRQIAQDLALIDGNLARTPLLRFCLQGAYLRPVGHDKELLRLIAAPARRPTAAGALRGMSLGMGCRQAKFTAPDLLRKLQIPMLLIWGRQDRFVPLSIGEKVASENPRLNLAVINGCGHCPHDETPEQFLEMMLTWLDRNLG